MDNNNYSQNPQQSGTQPGFGGQQPVGQLNYGAQPGMQQPGGQLNYGTPQPGMQQPVGQLNYGAQPGMQQPYGTPQSGMGTQPPKKKKTGLIVAIVVIVLALIGGGVFAFLKFREKSGADADKKAAKEKVETHLEGWSNQNLDQIVGTYLPDMQDQVRTNLLTMYGDTEEDMWNFYNETFGGLSVDYSVEDAEEVSGSDRSVILTTIESLFECDIDSDIMYSVRTDERYYGTNGEMTQNETVYLIEEDDEWYVVYAKTENNQTDVTTTEATEETTEETTEATTEAATEATTETTTEESGSGSMGVASTGYDWDNMPFTFEGTSYNLSTLTYADIQAMGYSIEDEAGEEELEDNQYSLSCLAEAADGSDMYVRFKNFTGGGTKKATECEILGVTLSRDDYSNFYDAALGNGVTFGMTVDEVKAIMGEPTDEYVDDDGDTNYTSLTYEESDEAYSCSVEITFWEGALDEITLENYD